MASKSVQKLFMENREARKILSELSALLGVASLPEISERTESMPITCSKTVRELAVEVPNATRVFEKLGIDYCCGGHKPLDEACEAAGVSVDQVLLALEQGGVATQPESARDWRSAPLAELVDHIISKHHTYVKSELPRLQALIAKVVGVHGKNHPELASVQTAFGELAGELTAHMMKEELILFPYIKKVSSGATTGPSCFGSVQNPIRMMMFEHDQAGTKLRDMREATRNYTLPPDACFSYGTLFSALQEFETDLHQHIHLENNILFPRTISLEG
jgi:regulator of cell morphogenesis and NO signaling